jgi:hypothetical protein
MSRRRRNMEQGALVGSPDQAIAINVAYHIRLHTVKSVQYFVSPPKKARRFH